MVRGHVFHCGSRQSRVQLPSSGTAPSAAGGEDEEFHFKSPLPIQTTRLLEVHSMQLKSLLFSGAVHRQ